MRRAGPRASIAGFGAVRPADARTFTPDYYAANAQLAFSDGGLKKLHDDLKRTDTQWQRLLLGLLEMPSGMLAMAAGPDARQLCAGLATYPLPIAADVAVVLEVVAGGRPLELAGQALRLLRARAGAAAGIATGVATVTGAAAAVSAAASAGIVDAPITLPTAATLGTVAAIATGIAALEGAIYALLDALINGELSEDNYRSLVRAGAAATGNSVSDQQIAASADFFYGARAAKMATARDAAKAKAKAKSDACKRRGGRFDPTAPNSCRVDQRPPSRAETDIAQTLEEETQRFADMGVKGQGMPWWAWALIAAGVGGGAYAILR